MKSYDYPYRVYRRPWQPGPLTAEAGSGTILETNRNRLIVAGVVLALAFLAIAARLIDVSVIDRDREPTIASAPSVQTASMGRVDIVDRNGVVLATNLPVASLYADPRDVLDAEEAVDRLSQVLPDLDRQDVVTKLRSASRFVWIRRNLTPNQQYRINRLGIPGLYFQNGEGRVYPHGRLASHVLGLTDVDGRGIAGLERQFDQILRSRMQPLRLSLDIRVQALVREELKAAVREFRALGGAAVVLDVVTGEILALISLPEFDPNRPETLVGEAGFNRVTKGVYEMGSTFKLFTAAMALDAGTVTLRDGYDASRPLRVSRFTITDFHPENRWLSVPEILVHSSNIGAAKMALDVGAEMQRAYLGRLGLLVAPSVELPEVATPLVPGRWREVNTVTIAYGHGIAVSPLQVATAVGTLVNGGFHVQPTLIQREPSPEPGTGDRVISEETSRRMRALMEMVVEEGTGQNARVADYRIGGKTGTAEKQVAGRYQRRDLISSFVGVFPIEAPRYAILALLDEPRGNKRTFNYATGGWVAAPAVGRIIARIAPMLGIQPSRNPRIEDAPPARSGEELVMAVRAALAEAREGRVAAH